MAAYFLILWILAKWKYNKILPIWIYQSLLFLLVLKKYLNNAWNNGKYDISILMLTNSSIEIWALVSRKLNVAALKLISEPVIVLDNKRLNVCLLSKNSDICEKIFWYHCFGFSVIESYADEDTTVFI